MAVLAAAPASLRAQTSGTETIIAGAGPESYPSLKIRGFTDVDFSSGDSTGLPEGFQLGQFVLHFTSPLARKVTFFGEVSMSPLEDQFRIEVERSFIRYDYNDLFKISAGRYHTPIGYWNTAFHHGLWLQTTVRRPEQIKFGGTFVPVHFLGVLAEGKLPSGGLGLSYAAGLGNGRAEVLSRDGDAGDANTNRAWLTQLVARPFNVYGLEAGGAVYRGEEIPELNGTYFYSDWCKMWIKSFKYANGEVTEEHDWTDELGTLGQVDSFGIGGDGELYLVTYEGAVAKFTAVR